MIFFINFWPKIGEKCEALEKKIHKKITKQNFKKVVWQKFGIGLVHLPTTREASPYVVLWENLHVLGHKNRALPLVAIATQEFT